MVPIRDTPPATPGVGVGHSPHVSACHVSCRPSIAVNPDTNTVCSFPLSSFSSILPNQEMSKEETMLIDMRYRSRGFRLRQLLHVVVLHVLRVYSDEQGSRISESEPRWCAKGVYDATRDAGCSSALNPGRCIMRAEILWLLLLLGAL